MNWYSSDHHIGHLRIPELAGRPFSCTPDGIEAMNAEIIRRHNELVDVHDKVTFLGDLAMGQISKSLARAGDFGGHKRLLAGNHDRIFPWFGTYPRYDWERWMPEYKAAGFQSVLACSGERAAQDQVEIAGHQVRMCHFPYRGGGDSTCVERYAEQRPYDRGHWLLCGHVHNAWRQRGHMINVGIDAWGGYPVSETQIAELIEEGPANREVIPW